MTSQTVAPPPPLARQRRSLLLALLALSAACWVATFWQASHVSGMPGGAGIGASMDASPATWLGSLTMGMSAPLFLATWVAMMAAMMLPSAAPMIVMFDAVQRTRAAQSRATVPTWVFTAAYLAVWAAFGALAYVVALAIERLAAHSPELAAASPRIAGVLLVAAGLYQLSPLKDVCLSKCRTPLAWVLSAWRNGRSGAFRMGFEHGAYCLGCCWFLFLILFPLGIMNVAVMAATTALIAAEKTLSGGAIIARLAGVGLVAAGAVVLAIPSVFPGQI